MHKPGLRWSGHGSSSQLCLPLARGQVSSPLSQATAWRDRPGLSAVYFSPQIVYETKETLCNTHNLKACTENADMIGYVNSLTKFISWDNTEWEQWVHLGKTEGRQDYRSKQWFYFQTNNSILFSPMLNGQIAFQKVKNGMHPVCTIFLLCISQLCPIK